MSKRLGMPTKKQLNVFHGRDAYDNSCMACGLEGELHRSHINPICNGGGNEPENLHLLCRVCHTESEAWVGDAYTAWYDARETSSIDDAWGAAMNKIIEIGKSRGWIAEGLSSEERRHFAQKLVAEFRG